MLTTLDYKSYAFEKSYWEFSLMQQENKQNLSGKSAKKSDIHYHDNTLVSDTHITHIKLNFDHEIWGQVLVLKKPKFAHLMENKDL